MFSSFLTSYEKSNFRLIFLSLLLLTLAISLLYSPYISIIVLFVFMFFSELWIGKISVVSCLPLLVVLLAYLASSRGIFLTEKDDLSDYYENFLVLSRGNYFAIFEFGGGIEVGFPFLSLLLSIIHPFAPPREFLFYHLIIIFSLYYIFLYKNIIRDIPDKEKAIFVIFTALFIGYTGVSNLLRQSYASIFILFALFSKKDDLKKYIIISVLFHYSSLLIYFLLKFILSLNLKRMIIFFVSCVCFYFLYETFFIYFLDDYQSLKLEAYINGDGVELPIVLNAYKEFFIIVFFVIYYRVTNQLSDNKCIYALMSFVIFTVVIESLLSGISLRINNMVLSFCLGPLLYLLFNKDRFIYIFFAVLIVPSVLLLKTYSFVVNSDDMALFNDGHYWYDSPMGYLSFLEEDIPNNKRLWKSLKYN